MSVGGDIIRWSVTDKGIVLRGRDIDLRGRGKNLPRELQLEFDPTDQTLHFELDKQKKMKLWKISSEEPPDLEAKMEKERLEKAKEADAVMNSRTVSHDEKLADKQKLLDALAKTVNQKPAQTSDSQDIRANMSPSDGVWNCIVTICSDSYFVGISVLEKEKKNRSPGLDYEPYKGALPDALPTVFALPEETVKKLIEWLTQQGIKFEDHRSVARGFWEIEGFSRDIGFSFEKGQKEKLLKTVEYLINDLFPKGKTPYIFRTEIYQR